MASSVDWEARSVKTYKIVKDIQPALKKFYRAHDKEIRMWWFAENYPPSFYLFVTFDGFSSVPASGLDMLTEVATTIAEAGLSKCKKFVSGNEVSYEFWLPMKAANNER